MTDAKRNKAHPVEVNIDDCPRLMEALQRQPKADATIHTCCDCGYQWQHGQHGVHSCVVELKKYLAAAQERVRELEKELRVANLKASHSLANNLCSDHRDKQKGKPCLACTIETLERYKSKEGTHDRYAWIVKLACKALGLTVECAPSDVEEAIEAIKANLAAEERLANQQSAAICKVFDFIRRHTGQEFEDEHTAALHTGLDFVADKLKEMQEQQAAQAAELERVRGERDAALSSRDFTHQWYGERWERLHQLLKEEGTPELFHRACSVIANGTAGMHEPPTYAQQLNRARHEAERLEKEKADLTTALAASQSRAERAEGERDKALDEIADILVAANTGFMTGNSNDPAFGEYRVCIKTKTLEECQRLHRLLLGLNEDNKPTLGCLHAKKRYTPTQAAPEGE